MTREEKAKRYDEAIERARAFNNGEVLNIKVGTTLCEYIFPELKESEDERIRKELIEMLRNWASVHYITKEQFSERMAWLENQGEPNPYSGVSFKYNGHTWGMCARDNGVEILVDGEIKERVLLDNKPQGKSTLEVINEEKVDNANEVEPKFKVGDIVQYITDSTDRRKIEEIDTLCNMYHTDSLPIMFEIENDWKVVLNSENVEPKFKIGDWITNANGDYTWKVISVDYLDYTLQNQWGECVEDTVDYVNKAFHLWTIQDAKDGDVLSANWREGANFWERIIIFNKYHSKGVKGVISAPYVEGYGNTFKNGKLIPCAKVPYYSTWTDNLYPATKEQRDLLFQKLKEAGYEWDVDNKELKKEEIK